jgi:hypothetical protein
VVYGTLSPQVLWFVSKISAITTYHRRIFFAPSAVVTFSFLPAPRPHTAPIYFHFYRLKSTNISSWGWEVLWIVLFIYTGYVVSSRAAICCSKSKSEQRNSGSSSSGRRKHEKELKEEEEKEEDEEEEMYVPVALGH